MIIQDSTVCNREAQNPALFAPLRLCVKKHAQTAVAQDAPGQTHNSGKFSIAFCHLPFELL